MKVKCPYCKKELSTLEFIQIEINKYSFNKNGSYKLIENVDTKDSTYLCPFCKDELFFDEEQAKTFLNGLSPEKDID